VRTFRKDPATWQGDTGDTGGDVDTTGDTGPEDTDGDTDGEDTDPGPRDTGGASGDTDRSKVEDPGGCGCAAGTGTLPYSAMLAMTALLARRRRS
jgi:uncharacterized protein (TIGR03382 family)